MNDSAPQMDQTEAWLRSPRPPAHLVRLGRWLWRLTLDIIDEYRTDGVGDLAAAITFWTLLSIPAAVLALISAVSVIEPLVGTDVAEDLQREITDFVSNTLADSQALNRAIEDLFGNSNAGLITIAAAVALFSLSRGFAGMIRALDVAYDVEDGRAWWHLRIVAIGLGIGSVVIVAGAATLLALAHKLPGAGATQVLVGLAAVGILVLWAATLFHLAPYHRTPWRYDLPGAVLTATGWVLATQGFAYYIRASNNANEVQSLVGAVLLGLTLLYLLAIILLVGAELNDVLTKRAGVAERPVRWRKRARDLKETIESRLDQDDDSGVGVAVIDDGSSPSRGTDRPARP